MKKPSLTSFLALAMTALAMGAPSALAQSNSLGATNEIISNPGKMIADYDTENLIPILQEMGIQHQGATSDDGTKVILAKSPNGLLFQMVPAACLQGANSGCVGLHIVAIFDEAPQRVVNSFNYRYAFTSAGVNPNDNTSYISRYIIADYGTPKGNIASNLGNYIAQAETFWGVVANASKTVSLESDPGDLAATSLNMQAALKDDLASSMIAGEWDIHRASMEETPGLISMLTRADKVSPGKIINFTKNKPE